MTRGSKPGATEISSEIVFKCSVAYLMAFLVFGGVDAWALDMSQCQNTVTLNGPGQPFGELAPPPSPDRVGERAIPVRSQGDRGICYGHAAAGLVDAWRFTHAPTRPAPGQPFARSSPVVAAVNATRDGGGLSSFNGGDPTNTVNIMRKAGASCDHDFVFSSTDWHSPSESSFVRLLEEAWDEFAAYMRDFRRAMDLDGEYRRRPRASWTPEMVRLERYHRLDDRIRGLPFDQWWGQFFYAHGTIAAARRLQCTMLEAGVPAPSIPTQTISGVNAILARIMGRAKSKLEFIQMYFEEACRGHRVSLAGVPRAVSAPPNPPTIGVYRPSQPDEAADDINRRLSLSDRQPVAISFCPAVLDKAAPDDADRQRLLSTQANWYTLRGNGTDEHPYEPRCESSDPHDPDPNGSHAALVIGRRRDPRNPGKCQFLLRNSWGGGCYRYRAAGWTDCENGEVWVDASTLSANIFETTYLDPSAH